MSGSASPRSGGSAGCGRGRAARRRVPPSSCFVATYYYVASRALIDARLHGERDARVAARLARPLELRRGQSLTDQQLDRSAERSRLRPARQPSRSRRVRDRQRRGRDHAARRRIKGQIVRVVFQKPPAPAKPAARDARRRREPPIASQRLELGATPSERLMLDAPVLDVAHRRRARKAAAGGAVGHPAAHDAGRARDRGPPLLRASRASIRSAWSARSSTNVPRQARYLAGAQHDHAAAGAQRLPAEDVRRHDAAGGARRSRRAASCSKSGCRSSSTQRASKDEILEMYLNDMPLGQRGSFGDRRRRRSVAAVLRQGRQQRHARRSGDDRRRHPVAVGAVAVQQPGALQGAPQRRAAGDGRRRLHRRRRPPIARRSEPLVVVQRALEAEAPYFVDYVGQTLDRAVSRADDHHATGGRRLHDARPAPAAARAGCGARRPDATSISCCRSASARARRKRRSSRSIRGRARSSRSSAGARTTSRSTTARSSSRRQPGSVFKPFVYLAAFEQARATRAAPTSRRRRSSTTSRRRSSSTIRCGRRRTTRTSTTARSRSAARSRIRATSATIHVAQAAGYDHVAALWKKLGVGNAPQAVPVDRARRVRGDAVRDRHRVHAVSRTAA